MRLRFWITPLVVLVAPSALVLAALPASAQQHEAAAEVSSVTGTYGGGLVLFQRYCRSCHGKKGEGDGQVATFLKVAPTDLTRLQVDNDGIFPAQRVLESVDGRELSVPLHGRDMPLWGAVFAVDDDQTEAGVQMKLANLLAYLEGIQVEPTDTTAEED